MRGTITKPAPAGTDSWMQRVVERGAVALWLVIATWVAFAIVFRAAMMSGVDLSPLVVVPVLVSTLGRPVRWAVPIAVTGGLLIFAFRGADGRGVAPVVIGTGVVAMLAVMVGLAGGLMSDLHAQSEASLESQARLQEIQAVYRTLYNELPVALWRTSVGGEILEVNDTFVTMFGYSRDELAGMHASELYAEPADRPASIQVVLDQGLMRGGVLEMRRKDGREVFLRVYTQVVHDDAGDVMYLDGVGTDVTGEVALERRAEVSDTRFRWAFESAPIGMALVDRDMVIVRANEALERFLGYLSGGLDGRAVDSISLPEDMDENRRIRSTSSDGGVMTYAMRKRYLRKDGKMVEGLLTATHVRGGAGAGYTVAFVMDLADQIRAQEALESLVRSKDEFLATVSHELRTPLTVVHGMAHELRDNWDAFGGEEGRELAGLIADQSSELAFLVEDLLVAARADAGTLEVKVEPVEIASEIESALASVPAPVRLQVTASTCGVAAQADRLRVRQIIRNLLTNAHRYGGQTVEVHTDDLADLGLVVVQVRDNGAGVPEDLARSIFEPYERAHSLGTVTEAVGLGLTVSRTLAESMGGGLEYRHDDGWSVFELTLRRAEIGTDDKAAASA